jgi:PAS domain S-box-containing protein
MTVASLSAPPRRRLSLRARLILLVLATVVPLTASTIFHHWQDYRDGLADAGRKTLELSRSLAIAVEKDLEGRIAALEVLGQSGLLLDGNLDRFRARAEGVIREQFPGSHILVLQPDGQQVINTNVPAGQPLRKRQEMTTIRQVMETGRPAVSGVFIGATYGRQIVSIDVPVKRPDGSILYILSLNPPLDAFLRTIARLHLPQGWTATIYDQSGVIVIRNIEPAKNIGQRAQAELLAAILANEEGVLRTTSREGQPVQAAFSRIDSIGWTVALGVPVEAITGPAIDEALRALMEAAVVLLLGLALALVLTRQVTRPMAALRGLAIAGDGERVLAARSTGLGEADEVLAALQEAERRRRDSERQREEAERIARRVFETSPDVMVVTDGQGTCLQASPSVRAALGYAPEEVEGRSAATFIHPADLETARTEMRAAKRNQTIHRFRARCLHRDGSIVPLHWTCVWSEPDRRLFLAGRDMTESDRRESELRQAQKMEAVGQLTGGVAHDFNNILMVIQANIEALQDEPALATEAAPELRARVESIGRSADRAAELTRQLLAFSRKQALSPRLTDLNGLIAETARLLARTLGARIEIGLELAADAWRVEIDRGQLDAALVNLALNARDAMPTGGRLTVATRNVTLSEAEIRSLSEDSDVVPGDYVVLSVADTGTGMGPEVQSKVFEPFFTTKEFGRGTGLGLSMVYGFIRQSRGHIAIRSAPGEGTTFSLYLPRAREERRPSPESGIPPRGGAECVLVVDDDAQVRAGIVGLLHSLGYVALEAPDAARGLAMLEAGTPPVDLVLTDIVMPGTMTGTTLAQEIARRFPAVRLVFMTGHAGSDGETPPGSGARVLHKPFRKADLARALRETLDA